MDIIREQKPKKNKRIIQATAVVAALILVTVLLVRPPFPVDETRYLAVAWEMWWRDEFLVPHLNGDTYSHKPPLLFWLMHAGWWLFGVNDWWPRLIAPLFSLLDLALLAWLASIMILAGRPVATCEASTSSIGALT